MALALTGATRSPSRGVSRSPDQAPAPPSGFRSRFPPSGNSPVALALTGLTRSPSCGVSCTPVQALALTGATRSSSVARIRRLRRHPGSVAGSRPSGGGACALNFAPTIARMPPVTSLLLMMKYPRLNPLRLRYTYPLAIITIPVAADITGSRKDVKENRFTLRTH